MSNGSTNNKQPKLRRSPPTLPPGETLQRLSVLSDWTEEPAKKAAQALEPDKPAAEASPPQEAAETPAVPQKSASEYPWSEQGDSKAKQPLYLRIPVPLYLKLKWLGDTTFGTDMTAIAVQALNDKVQSLLKERGIEP